MKVREENPEKKTAEQENSTRDMITELGQELCNIRGICPVCLMLTL